MFCFQLYGARAKSRQEVYRLARNSVSAEIASVYAEVAHYLGYIEVPQSVDEKTYSLIYHYCSQHGRKESIADEQSIITEFGPPSWVVNGSTRVLGYCGAGSQKWLFFDLVDDSLRGTRYTIDNAIRFFKGGQQHV
ncbi:MAG: hypothetical protein R3C28_11645 [Pirellulaceae bacterium]